MPKVTIDNSRGLVQETGTGVVIKASGAIGQKYTAVTSLISGGANDVEMTLTQPANSVLCDVGFILTTAIAGSSGNSNFKVGTADDGAQIVAATALMSSATAAAIGSGITLSGLKSEGAAALAIVADAAVYTATERTLFLRLENSAAITAGAGKAFISYMILP
ncbi:MAG: hypothetical protein CMA72_09340 [Euryarchaeota archaeon]|nr:hypothetical protein [Euryarchaeota archaeon]|tara:strand:- start:107 stop:595 length:489 start_codon:yes stop_codon:yes gene_type:complete